MKLDTITTTLAGSFAALLLSGCAALNSVSSEVSTYGPWPAERKPDTFAFERLPSQQAHPERQQMLEDAARGAVEAAGFRAAADAGNAAYLLQVGARVTTDDPWAYNEPLFWPGGMRLGYGGGFRHGWGRRGFIGAGFSPWGSYDYWPANFDREVAVLIRDRKTGQVLYEARASNSGPSPAINHLLPTY